jgi:hypothetical protein
MQTYLGCTVIAAKTNPRGRTKMKAQIETTKKTTVTLSVKDFLENLGLEVSGKLTAVIITPERKVCDGFSTSNERTAPASVNLYFEKVERENVED